VDGDRRRYSGGADRDREVKARCQLAADAPVRSCYEAGRDGFWLHRWLAAHGITNLVVDPASIEVNRRARRAKTDRLDADKLLSMLRTPGFAQILAPSDVAA